MKFPNIHKFNFVADYFQNFYNLNHQSPEFTYRHFADEIGWPHSYMNDLIKGRKPLTLKRALEFSHFSKMTAPETERLIALGLIESCPEEHKAFFKEHLSSCLDFNLRIDPKTVAEEVDGHTRLVDPEVFKDPSLLGVLAGIKWLREAANHETLSKYLFSFPELRNPEVFEEKLAILESQKCIRRENGKIQLQNADVYFCHPEASAMEMTVENLLRTMRAPQQRGSAWTGFALVRKNRLLEMSQRAAALTNWLFLQDTECVENNVPMEECFPVKYDVFLNHVADLTHLGYSVDSDESIQLQTTAKADLQYELLT